MKTRLILNYWQDILNSGGPNDSRLLHADTTDLIWIYPADLGQGYRQKIPLRDDLSLEIVDYVLEQDMMIDFPGQRNRLAFEFELAHTDTSYSTFVPHFGFSQLEFIPARKRNFVLKVIFHRPGLMSYFESFTERLPTHTKSLGKHVMQSICRYRGQRAHSTMVGMLAQILDSAASSDLRWNPILTDTLCMQAVDLRYACRSLISPAMKQVMGEILSCPYRGAIRRTYLERKVLELVGLRLAAIVKPRLSIDELSCIYQAAAILKNCLANPPTIATLTRLVGTNRLKLNQGFHQVYGTTPFGYLRDCRLMEAQRLLVTSELSVVDVAKTVGYSSRSHFAIAFRQQTGLNPKTFQMYAWQCAS
ncbi:MAG: AraC family transcriptional regulator [Cyanobacteria bacterium P01_B01_bin.77]